MISPIERRKTLVLAVLFIFCSMGLWTSDWFEINGRGTYTEGIDREPSIVIEYTIDSSQESISVSLENATPLLQYWRNRETISDHGGNNANQDDIPVASSSDDEESSSLDITRTFVAIILFFFGLCMVEAVRKSSKIWSKVTLLAWIILGFSLILQVPMSAISDFGLSEDSESSTGGFDSANNDEVSVDQFAHYSSDFGMSLDIFSLRFDYNSQGYDLGLLVEEDRQPVIDNPPQDGESGYESFIQFKAEMKAGTGPVVYWWLALGFLAIYLNRSFKTISSEGIFSS